MNNNWVRIFKKVKEYTENLITILTSTGSKPAGDLLTIENSNSLIYDELASLGQFIGYPIPVEYHVTFETKRFELQNYASSGGNYYPYSYQPYPFDYNGDLAVLYRYSTGTNAYAYALYFYSDSTYVSLPCTIPYITYVEFNGSLFVYGLNQDPNIGIESYYKQTFDSNYLLTNTETLSEPYFGGDSRFMPFIELIFSSSGGYYYQNSEKTYNIIKGEFPVTNFGTLDISVPQKLSDGWFWSCFDKCIFTDENYIPTRMIQFNDPMLMGHSNGIATHADPRIVAGNNTFYLADIYRLYDDGRIERFKID